MTLYLIILVGITGHVGFNGSRIAMSLYALELGANQFTIGVLVALYAIFPMLLAIYVGKLVDRFGTLLPVILGVIGMTIALVLPPLIPGIPVLYASITLLGLAHLLFMIPIEACIGGIGGPDRSAANYALLSMGWSVANFFGPVIAGFSIDNIGHREAFWVLASFSVIPILILAFKPELLPKASPRTKKDQHGSVLELLRIPPLRTFIIIGATINSGQNLFQFYFPIYGHSLGLSASAIGSIIGVVAAAAFVVRGLIPFLMKSMTEATILTYAIFIAAFSFALLPFVSNPYALGAIAFVLGLGVGCGNPLSMSMVYVLSPPGRTAESLGILRGTYNLAQLVVPIAFGSVGTAFGYAVVFLSNASLLAAGGLLMRKMHLPGAERSSK